MNIYSSPDYAAVAGMPCVCESVGSERAYALIQTQRISDRDADDDRDCRCRRRRCCRRQCCGCRNHCC